MTRINKTAKKLFPIIVLIVVLVPVLASAQNQFVPCGGWNYDANGNKTTQQKECGYADLFEMINRIIKWVVMMAVPVSAGVFAWAGLNMMMNPTNPGKRKDSIEMMKKVGIGLVFILGAWILVTTITNTLMSDKFKSAVPVEGVK